VKSSFSSEECDKFVSVAKEVYPRLDIFKSPDDLLAATCAINSDPNFVKLPPQPEDEDNNEDVVCVTAESESGLEVQDKPSDGI
jgi:hypothetical protein